MIEYPTVEEKAADIETTFDYKEECMAAGLAMCADHHEVCPDSDWIRRARRITKIPTLFIYWHKGTRAFVLANWIIKPEVCMELEILGDRPDGRGWMSDAEIIGRCRPVDETAVTMRRQMKEASYMRRRALRDEAIHKVDTVKFLRSQGFDKEAYELESGRTPWSDRSTAGAQYDETMEMLRAMVRCS